MDDRSIKSFAEKSLGFLSRYWLTLALGGLFVFLIWVWGSGWLDSYYENKYHADKMERLAEIERLKTVAAGFRVRMEEAEDREAVKDAENQVLKKENEEYAKLLNEADGRLRARAAEIDRISDQFDRKLNEISSTPSKDQKCAACADARELGLSFTFCEQCVR